MSWFSKSLSDPLWRGVDTWYGWIGEGEFVAWPLADPRLSGNFTSWGHQQCLVKPLQFREEMCCGLTWAKWAGIFSIHPLLHTPFTANNATATRSSHWTRFCISHSKTSVSEAAKDNWFSTLPSFVSISLILSNFPLLRVAGTFWPWIFFQLISEVNLNPGSFKVSWCSLQPCVKWLMQPRFFL